QGDIDPERPPPGKISGQPTAQQRAQSRRPADRRTPDAEGDSTVSPAEVGMKQRQRGGQHHRPTDALHGPRQDQQTTAGRHSCEYAGGSEDDGTQREDPTSPVLVRESSTTQQ